MIQEKWVIKILFVVTSIIFIGMIYNNQLTNNNNMKKEVLSPGADKLVIYYGSHKGKDAELVVNNAGGVRLRVRYNQGDYNVYNESTLNFLVKEVFNLTSDDNPVPLGSSKYSVLLLEGKPIWGPSVSHGPEGSAQNLYFGKGAIIRGKVIYVHGKLPILKTK